MKLVKVVSHYDGINNQVTVSGNDRGEPAVSDK